MRAAIWKAYRPGKKREYNNNHSRPFSTITVSHFNIKKLSER